MEQENQKQELEKQLNTLYKVKDTLYSNIKEVYKDQNKILKQIQEIEQARKKDYKDYLEGFDEEFETHTKERIRETPLLLALFNEFIQQVYRPSKIYKLAKETKSIINTELTKFLNDEQKNLLEQWQYCEDRILDDMVEQAFIYGYATSVQLRDDAVKQYPYNKK